MFSSLSQGEKCVVVYVKNVRHFQPQLGDGAVKLLKLRKIIKRINADKVILKRYEQLLYNYFDSKN